MNSVFFEDEIKSYPDLQIVNQTTPQFSTNKSYSKGGRSGRFKISPHSNNANILFLSKAPKKLSH